jgi:multimeric flavodoxin WrbA
LGNEHGKPKIQPCNACVSSSIALCPAIATGRIAITRRPSLDLDLYARLARADAWAFIGPINSYGSTSNFKLLFESACLHERRQSSTGFDRQERARFWRKLSSVPPN